MVSAIWGVFVWKEFPSAATNARKLTPLMCGFFLTGLAAVALATVDSATKGRTAFEDVPYRDLVIGLRFTAGGRCGAAIRRSGGPRAGCPSPSRTSGNTSGIDRSATAFRSPSKACSFSPRPTFDERVKVSGRQPQRLYNLVQSRWGILPYSVPLFSWSATMSSRGADRQISTSVGCLSKEPGKEFRYTSAEISGARFERF